MCCCQPENRLHEHRKNEALTSWIKLHPVRLNLDQDPCVEATRVWTELSPDSCHACQCEVVYLLEPGNTVALGCKSNPRRFCMLECTGLTLCIVDLYFPLVHLSSMSPRLTTMVPGSDGTSIQASLHLQPQHEYKPQPSDRTGRWALA